jgi:hypothetical protein
VKEQSSWTYDLRKQDDPRSSVCSMVGILSFVENKARGKIISQKGESSPMQR